MQKQAEIELYDIVSHPDYPRQYLRVIEMSPVCKLTKKVMTGYLKAELRQGLGHPVKQTDLIEHFTLVDKGT